MSASSSTTRMRAAELMTASLRSWPGALDGPDGIQPFGQLVGPPLRVAQLLRLALGLVFHALLVGELREQVPAKRMQLARFRCVVCQHPLQQLVGADRI